MNRLSIVLAFLGSLGAAATLRLLLLPYLFDITDGPWRKAGGSKWNFYWNSRNFGGPLEKPGTRSNNNAHPFGSNKPRGPLNGTLTNYGNSAGGLNGSSGGGGYGSYGRSVRSLHSSAAGTGSLAERGRSNSASGAYGRSILDSSSDSYGTLSSSSSSGPYGDYSRSEGYGFGSSVGSSRYGSSGGSPSSNYGYLSSVGGSPDNSSSSSSSWFGYSVSSILPYLKFDNNLGISGGINTTGNGSTTTTTYNPRDWVDHKWVNKYDLVSVVVTDFLQFQQVLINLLGARMELFQTFTLTSMIMQTTQQYIWLIYVDPNLVTELKDKVTALVQGLPNVFIIGHIRVKGQDFRSLHGLNISDIPDHLIYGDLPLLLDYFSNSQSHVTIETRLDADDALSVYFMDSVQAQASSSLGTSQDPTDYRVFCAEHHIEWRYYHPTIGPNITGLMSPVKRNGSINNSNYDERDGYLVHYYNPHFCVNTGLTIGYQIQARERNLKHTAQSYFAFWMVNCGDKPLNVYDQREAQKVRCLARVFMPLGSEMGAVLARTPVAAGMKHVLGTSDDKPYEDTFESPEKQQTGWDLLLSDFNVNKHNVRNLRASFESNIEPILREALIGQCSPTHSCKDSSKKKLGRLLQTVQAQNA